MTPRIWFLLPLLAVFITHAHSSKHCMLPVTSPHVLFAQDDAKTPTLESKADVHVDVCNQECCQDPACNVVVYHTEAKKGDDACFKYGCEPFDTCTIKATPGFSIYVDGEDFLGLEERSTYKRPEVIETTQIPTPTTQTTPLPTTQLTTLPTTIPTTTTTTTKSPTTTTTTTTTTPKPTTTTTTTTTTTKKPTTTTTTTTTKKPTTTTTTTEKPTTTTTTTTTTKKPTTTTTTTKKPTTTTTTTKKPTTTTTTTTTSNTPVPPTMFMDSNGTMGTGPKKASNLMAAILIATLSIGCVIVLTVISVLGKRIYDSYRKRHYSRLDYLINGMYN